MSVADCFDHDPDLLPVETVRQRLQERLRPMVGTETVPLGQAAGRVLAEPAVSPFDIPRFDNVAVDGWAFAFAPAMAEQPTKLLIQAGRAAAGAPFAGEVAVGHALRVLTGAVLPEGCDSVALQEEAVVEDGRIGLPAGMRQHDNRRPSGEDMRAGETVLAAGHLLRPQHIGALAHMGQGEVRVFARLQVAVMSTGDEVVEPGKPLPEGGIYDANRHILLAMLAKLPVAARDLGRLPDDPGVIGARLEQAAASCDLILTSGGASQGDEDHLAACLERLGTLRFWRIALKPGRPLLFGQIGRCLVMGLPGNPVAASLCLAYLGRPLIQALCGAPWREPHRLMLPLDGTLRKKAGRTELVRAKIIDTDAGQRVTKIRKQGSGVLTSLVEAHGVIELATDITSVEPGSLVPFIPLESLGLA